MMFSLTGLFKKVSNCFTDNTATVPVDHVIDALGLESGKFDWAEGGDDIQLLHFMGKGNLYHLTLSEPAMAAYSDAQRKTPLWVQNPPPDEDGQGFPPDGQMGTSAAIVASRYGLPFGRFAILAMIRADVSHSDSFRDAMVFGMYGTYGSDRNFKFKKMLVPEIDQYRRMTGVREADVTDPAEIVKALKYIELCKNQIFDGSPLFARDNWRAVSINPPPAAPHIS